VIWTMVPYRKVPARMTLVVPLTGPWVLEWRRDGVFHTRFAQGVRQNFFGRIFLIAAIFTGGGPFIF